jgi:hypothetical protein
VRRVIPVLIPLVVVCACSSTDSGTIQLTTCGETDTFSQSPQPTKLVVSVVDQNGDPPTQLASVFLPTDSIDLGNQSETAAGTIVVEATDSNANELVYGQSLALEYGALANSTLSVFVQRTNQWARLCNPPSDTRSAPTLAIFSGEFLFVGGGSDPTLAQTTQLYDFAALAPLSAPPGLPRVPMSMPVSGTVALLIDTQGATYYDFSQDAQTTDVTAPMGNGFTFADVAGGEVVYELDTSGNVTMVFVVGATRTTGGPTKAVLQINPNDTSNSSYVTGNLSWATLTDYRLGATATWVPGRGLVITGGSATAGGVEVIPPSTNGTVNGTVLVTTPDPSMGAGAVGLYNDTQDLLVVGGITPTGQDAGIRKINLGDPTAAPTSWGSLPIPLTSATAFSFASGGQYQAVVVGNELASGLTHAYLLNSTGAKEVPTKVPHINARAIQSPIDSIVIVGGSPGGEIESFYPTL